jgi:hypothetical protein
MADLWTRPTSTPYQFATDPGVRLEPIAGRKAQGWVPGEPVSALQANDLWGVASDWVVLLEAIAPADGTLAAQAVELYDTAATPALAATWTAGSVADSALLTVGSGEFEFREKGLVGPRAIPDSDGVRYGYDSSAKLQIVYDVSPQSRAYMVHMVTLAATSCVMVFGAGNVGLYYGDAVTAEQAVFRSQIALPIEAGQTTRFPVIKKLEATDTGAADDLEIAIVRITRSTGAETDLGLINASSPANTFGGGSTTDPLTYTYALEIRSDAAIATGGLTADGVRNALLTIQWQTLNPSP